LPRATEENIYFNIKSPSFSALDPHLIAQLTTAKGPQGHDDKDISEVAKKWYPVQFEVDF